MTGTQFVDWWEDDVGAAQLRYEKAIQFSHVSALPPEDMGTTRPVALNNVSAGRGFYGSNNSPSRLRASPKPPPYNNSPSLPLVVSPKPPPNINRDTKLTITLMTACGLAGCIGVTVFFIVQMALQIVGWAI